MSIEIGFLIRTGFLFFLLMIIIRVLGKREVGQLSIFDLVILLIIADIGSIGIDNKKIYLESLLSLILLLILQKLFAKLLLKVSFLRQIIDGKPSVIIKNGEINYKAMQKEKYNFDDLICQLRLAGCLDIKDVRLAILETTGDLTVFLKSDEKEIMLPIIVSGKIDLNMALELELNEKKILELLNDNRLELKKVLYALSDGKSLISVKTRS